MEEKNSNKAMEDVRVYITIDPKDLEKLRERQVREQESKCYILSDVKRLFRDAWEDLGVQTNCQFIVSSKGLVLCFVMILSIILIIVVATQWFLGESQVFGIIANSLTLLSCFFHIFVKVTELDKLVSSHALVIAVQLLKDISLLVLQFAAFIVYMACSYYFPVAAVMLYSTFDSLLKAVGNYAMILTIFLCCGLLLSIFLTSLEYNREGHARSTRVKKKKKTRKINKKVSYKRLQHY